MLRLQLKIFQKNTKKCHKKRPLSLSVDSDIADAETVDYKNDTNISDLSSKDR